MNNSHSLTHFLRTVYRKRTTLSVVLLAVIIISLLSTQVGAQSTCVTSGPPSNSYDVTVCIDDPLFGDTLTGSKNVITSISVAGQDPGVQKVIYYLDGAYLLTDFASGYSFVLPTDHFVDGPHTLEAEALMRDGYTSDRVAIDLTFGNGNIEPPVNTNTFTPYTGTPVAGQPFIVAATGDGASGRPDAAAVSSLIASRNPDLFLYLGDVYELGTYTEFSNWYGSNGEYFDQFHDITNPTVGNHEMQDGAAPGYRYYWDNVDYYYSFDSAGWHIINLTSIGSFDEYKPGTPQYEWLVQDLNSATSHCTAAYFHHPVFSVGPQGDSTRMDDIWSLLAQHGVDVVLTGHEHSYQRWERLDAAGNLDPQGIAQFVSGGGGHGIQGFVRTDPRLSIGYDTVPDAFGSLFLTLNPDGLSFEYVNIMDDQLDFGVVPCSGAPSDTVPPSTPVLSGAVNAAGYPELDWTASVDNSAVASYEISRDGALLGSVNGGKFKFVDTTAQFGATYDYTVRAVDAGGNPSGESNLVSIMTGQSGTLVLNPEADAYVHQSNPSINYGSSSKLYTDASPDIHSYLRFDIPTLPGVVESAKLRVYANNSSSEGFTVHDINSVDWQENSLTYNNAPGVSGQLGSSGPLVSGTFAEVDMTAVINGNSQLNIAMITSSTSNKSYSSREGTNPPELVIEVVDPNQPTPTPTPTNTPTITPTPLNTPTPTPVATPGTSVLMPVADSYVSAQAPTSNYGTNTNLRTDGAPDLRSYLRFDVPPLSGYLVSATIRVYATSNSSTGYDLHEVVDDSWAELGINYDNAPAVGNVVGSSGAITSGSWTTIDVTSLISGGELLSLAMTSTHARAISYSSRDGTNPPELVIETSGTPPATETPTPLPTPTNTPAPTPTPTSTPSPPPPDTIPPSMPTNLHATNVTYASVDLAWDASTDNVGVTSYTIYRDASFLANVDGSTTSYQDGTVAPDTSHSYTVEAFDAAGNNSGQSTALPVTTPSTPSAFTFVAVADSYVEAAQPTKNQGSSSLMRIDGDPVRTAYLRFDVQGLTGAVTQATLRVYANSSSSVGYDVRGVSDNNWDESTINYNNAPAFGAVVGSTGPFDRQLWTELDVTLLINGDGTYSLALTNPHTTAISLASRESANPPELIVDVTP